MSCASLEPRSPGQACPYRRDSTPRDTQGHSHSPVGRKEWEPQRCPGQCPRVRLAAPTVASQVHFRTVELRGVYMLGRMLGLRVTGEKEALE